MGLDLNNMCVGLDKSHKVRGVDITPYRSSHVVLTDVDVIRSQLWFIVIYVLKYNLNFDIRLQT